MTINLDSYNSRFRALAVSCIVLFISIIVFAFSLYSAANSGTVKVVNISDAKSEGLSSDIVKGASKAMYSFLRANGYDVSGSDIRIRDAYNYDADNDKSGSFLVDIDNIRQTYKYSFADGESYISCPSIAETNYPDSYCSVGGESLMEYNDTATMVLGDILPYDGRTEDGVSYRIYRRDLKHDLFVYVFTCEGNSEADSSVEKAVSSLIEDRGANPSIFPVVYEHNNCSE